MSHSDGLAVRQWPPIYYRRVYAADICLGRLSMILQRFWNSFRGKTTTGLEMSVAHYFRLDQHLISRLDIITHHPHLAAQRW